MEPYRIFLSSTFVDLKAERSCVADVIHRMADIYDGMEDFGSYPHMPLDECLMRVRSANIVVLVLGYRHGHISKGSRRSIVEKEYHEAISNDIPVIPYVADRGSYPPPEVINPRIERFRALLRTNHGAECFKSPENLSAQVAADIYRYVKRRLTSLDEDAVNVRADAHRAVLESIEDNDYHKAKRLNEKILSDYRDSPRAHYNHACILSVLSAEAPNHDVEIAILRNAYVRLSDALRFGILKFIALYADRTDATAPDAAQFILTDTDLQRLFAEYPSAVDDVKKGRIILGRGCAC